MEMPRETRSAKGSEQRSAKASKRKEPAAKRESAPKRARCVRGEKPQEPSSEVEAPKSVDKRSRRRLAIPLQSSLPSSDNPPPQLLPPPNPVPRASEGPPQGDAAAGKPLASRPDPMAGRQPSEEDEEELGRSLSSANSALQGLLKKLGSGYEDLLPGMGAISGGRLKSIVSGLKQVEDEGQQLACLNELCEMLSISSEDAVATFPVETIVPLLVQLLNMEHNPDIMLLAARALTFMADVMPTSCGAIVRYEAVPAFCARLLTIEYIDLAEQSLQALEKLSHEYSHHLLQSGGLLAVLSYLDFFPTGVQRVAVATASNMCRRLSPEHHEAVSAAVPILTNLLQYQDAKVVDHACSALCHIADSYSTQPQLLNVLSGGDLVSQSLQLLAISQNGAMTSQLSLNTYYSLLKLLSTCASASPEFAHSLLNLSVLDVLRQLLATSTLVSSSGSSLSVLRSADQLSEVISLACELLPPITEATAVMLKGLSATAAPSAATAGGYAAATAAAMPSCSRVAFIAENPAMMKRFGVELLPMLLQVFGSTVMPQVRHKTLCAVTKVLFFSTTEMLEESLKEFPVSSFIAGLLSSKDTTVVAYAVQMAEILMSKQPSVFGTSFLKEGVVHGMEQLAATVTPAPPTVTTAPPPPVVASVASAAPSATPPRGTRSTASKLKEALFKGTGLAKANDLAKQQTAAPPPPPPPPPPVAPSEAAAKKSSAANSIRSALATRAALFKSTHYASHGSCPALETEGLKQMRQVSNKLADTGGPEPLAQMLRVLDGSGSGGADKLGSSSGSGAAAADSISVFEFLTSGAAKKLLEYAKGGDLAADADAGRRDEQLLRRLLEVFEVSFTPGSGSHPPVAALVSKLLAGLAALETFPVLCSRANVSTGARTAHGHGSLAASRSAPSTAGMQPGSLSSGLMALTQPFKLRLARHSTDSALKEYSSNIVLIEPLATMAAIEEFLWQRVHRPVGPASAPATAIKPPGQNAARELTPESLASSLLAKLNEAPASAPPTSKAQAIPEVVGTRRVTRSQAASDAGHTAGLAAVPVPSPASVAGTSPGVEDVMEEEEDEEDGMEHAMFEGEGEEYDEEIDGEQDDGDEGDLNLSSVDVHDLHIGSEAEGSAAAATAATAAASAAAASATLSAAAAAHMASAAAARSAWQPGSRASGSAGAAAAAAVAAPSPPKLAFYLGNLRLSPHTTVFQAIQQINMGSALAAAAANQDVDSGSEEDNSTSRIPPAGRRMWEDVHTLHYRLAEGAEEPLAAGPDAAAAGGSGRGTNSNGGAGSSPRQWTKGPLGELLCAGLPDDLLASQQCKVVIDVLQLLEKMNRLGPRLSASLSSNVARPSSKTAPVQHGRMNIDTFHSSKVSSKLGQQLKDVLVICGGCLPPWCSQLVFRCKFLFPLEVRRRFFYCTALGMGRALQHMQQLHTAEVGGAPASDRELRVGRLQRQKVRVSRKRILESAVKVMELYAKQRAVLELEYFGEVGTGLGPTLEFYTLLSQELQKRSLGMWRHEDATAPERSIAEPTQEVDADTDDNLKSASAAAAAVAADVKTVAAAAADKMMPAAAAAVAVGTKIAGKALAAAGVVALSKKDVWTKDSELVNAPFGLFPQPLLQGERGADSMVVSHFRLLGRSLGKAFQDSRLMDLPLNHVFYTAAMGRPVDQYDIVSFDPQVGSVLERLAAAVRAHKAATASAASPVMLDGVPVEDLSLTFTLPGTPSYELCPGGADKDVDSSNVEEYLTAVVDALLGSGIQAQLQAFREGFDEVFPLKSLECFYEDEIETLLCGSGEHWTLQSLTDSIKFDHGYTSSSLVVRHFLEILEELDGTEQRRFLRFVTGCPRLPPGGLSALQPRLTVVRKHPSQEEGGTPVGSVKDGSMVTTTADSDLPSVMTCANYFKLPPYSSKEVMRNRLMFAITEGQGSFDLS